MLKKSVTSVKLSKNKKLRSSVNLRKFVVPSEHGMKAIAQAVRIGSMNSKSRMNHDKNHIVSMKQNSKNL